MSIKRVVQRVANQYENQPLAAHVRNALVNVCAPAIAPMNEDRFWTLLETIPWPTPEPDSDERAQLYARVRDEQTIVEVIAMFNQHALQRRLLDAAVRETARLRFETSIAAFVDRDGIHESQALFTGDRGLTLALTPSDVEAEVDAYVGVICDDILARGRDEHACALADPMRVEPLYDRYDPIVWWRERRYRGGIRHFHPMRGFAATLRDCAQRAYSDEVTIETARKYGGPVSYHAGVEVRVFATIDHPKFGLGLALRAESERMARFVFADQQRVLLAKIVCVQTEA